MALGKTNRIDGKAYSLKLKLKDGATFLDVPVFDVQEKQGDNYVSIQKVTDVSGDLIKVETRQNEYEGSPIRNVKLALRDAEKGEVYFTEFGLGSGLGRGLANSLLSLKAYSKIEIGLYGQKSKKDGKTYPAVSLRQGGTDDTVKWAYDPKEGVIPPAREFEGKGGKVERDWTKTEEFLFAKIQEFAAKVAAAQKGEQASQETKSEIVPAKEEPKQSAPAKTEAPKGRKKNDESVPF